MVNGAAACSGGGGGGGGGGDASPLAPFFGDYGITLTGRVGGEYAPSGSIVSGTTAGVRSFTRAATITLSAARLGLMAVPPGMQIPGVAPADVIYGTALMRNPVDVFIGTAGASDVADFGVHTTLTFGIPVDFDANTELRFSGAGCAAGGSGDTPMDCIPLFFEPRVMSGRNVNLTYLVNRVAVGPKGITVRGLLLDRHAAEAAVANVFMVPIQSPIVGSINDIFWFGDAMSFEFTISGGAVTGSIGGTGQSVAGMVPQTAIFQATFTGVRK